MNNEIIKYEPFCVITLFSKKQYYIKAKNREQMERFMKKERFIKIGETLINVASIETIEELDKNTNMLENILVNYDYDTRIKIRNEVALYKENHAREVTEPILYNMIKKVTNGANKKN